MVNKILFMVYRVANKMSKDWILARDSLVKVHCYLTLFFNYTFKYHSSNTYWYQFNHCEYMNILKHTCRKS